MARACFGMKEAVQGRGPREARLAFMGDFLAGGGADASKQELLAALTRVCHELRWE